MSKFHFCRKIEKLQQKRSKTKYVRVGVFCGRMLRINRVFFCGLGYSPLVLIISTQQLAFVVRRSALLAGRNFRVCRDCSFSTKLDWRPEPACDQKRVESPGRCVRKQNGSDGYGMQVQRLVSASGPYKKSFMKDPWGSAPGKCYCQVSAVALRRWVPAHDIGTSSTASRKPAGACRLRLAG